MTKAITSLLTTVALLAGVPSAAQARSSMRSVFEDDCMLVQLSNDPHCNKADRNEALNTIASLGADTVRIMVIRDKVQDYGWTPFDLAVDGIRARHMQPLLSLTDRLDSSLGRSPAQFGDWVREVVEHYGNRVHLWSIYNEPNLRYFLGIPTKRNGTPREWRDRFVAGQNALRSVPGHGHDTVLLGELAPRSTANNGTATGPLFMTREFFCLDKHLKPYRGSAASKRGCNNFKRITADGFAYHPYTNAALAPPTFKDPGDGASYATLGRLTSILDAAARAKRTNRNMSVWNTESGFQSNPPDRHAPSPAKQAEYINQAEYMQYRNRRVASTSQYELNDAADRASYNTGLRYANGKRKPAFDAYRLPIWVTRSGRGFVRVFLMVRPGGRNTAEIQRQSGGRGKWRNAKRVRTNGSGYAWPKLRGGGRDRFRIVWRNFHSRTDRIH